MKNDRFWQQYTLFPEAWASRLKASDKLQRKGCLIIVLFLVLLAMYFNYCHRALFFEQSLWKSDAIKVTPEYRLRMKDDVLNMLAKGDWSLPVALSVFGTPDITNISSEESWFDGMYLRYELGKKYYAYQFYMRLQFNQNGELISFGVYPY